MKQFYAHSTDSKNTSDWQLLDTHLNNVAERAGRFADHFGGRGWAETRCAKIFSMLELSELL